MFTAKTEPGSGDLFNDSADTQESEVWIGEAAVLLRGFARPDETTLLAELEQIISLAPFRHMITPGGFEMSVAMTNCGHYGWVSDNNGYRYDPRNPLTGKAWPAMPAAFSTLANNAAAAAGFKQFHPDVCLINCYEPGAKLSLHQDKDEQDFLQPIVSVSLGVPAVFLFGGLIRNDRTERIPLAHGDVVVWGGPDRMRYHGVLPLKECLHPLLGNRRINLTFRRAR